MKSRGEIYREWEKKKTEELSKLDHSTIKDIVNGSHLRNEFEQYYKNYKEDKPATPKRLSPHKIRR